MTHEKLFKYIGIAAILLLLFGLLGWYLFIQKQTRAVQGADAARGFSIGIPSFLGSRGSTAANTGGASSGGSASGAAVQETGGTETQSAFLRFLGIGSGSGTGERAQVGVANPAATGERSVQRAPRFWRVSLTPVAGASFIGAGASTTLRYVERATGQVFDVNPNSGEARRISNTLTPKIYEAYVGGNNVVVERTIDAGLPATLVGTIGSTTEEGTAPLLMKSLGVNITAIATRHDSSDLLMLTRAQGSVRLIRTKSNGGSPTLLLSIPAGDFRIYWPSNTRLLLAEKAGSGVAGSAFSVSSTLSPVISSVLGLTILPHPSSGALLYGSDDGVQLHLFARAASSTDIALPLATVADKCVWAPTGLIAYCAVPQQNPPPQFLDLWYRGKTHTTDSWYTVSVGAGSAEKLFTMDSAQAVDVESPVIDTTGNYLAFLNARDKSLWILRINDN